MDNVEGSGAQLRGVPPRKEQGSFPNLRLECFDAKDPDGLVLFELRAHRLSLTPRPLIPKHLVQWRL